MSALTVVVDADACPRGAMAVLRKLQAEFGFELVTVASFDHSIDGECHITVGNASDEADLAVANRVSPGDIAVTQDWGLASLVLAKGGLALSPKGLIYSPQNMDFLLDERHAKAKLRRQGGRTKGPRARTAEDDIRFESSLRRLLTSNKAGPFSGPSEP